MVYYGWTQVIAEVFHRDISGDVLHALARIAVDLRHRR